MLPVFRPPTPAPVATNPPAPVATNAPTPVATNDMFTSFDFIANDPDLTDLLETLVRAGLVDALSSEAAVRRRLTDALSLESPFTFFAPSNDAFAAVPADIFDQLFFDDNFIPQLVDLLLLHFVDGLFLLADLELVGPSLLSLNKEVIFVDFPPLTVNLNNVVDGDNIVANSVIHKIDGVLLPSWVFNSLANRINFDDLSTLFTLLVLAGIDLSGPSALTVVGPTNDASGLLDPTFVAFLQTPDGLAELTSILTYHVFPGILTSKT
jgi:transforming growth factor-beta-induced protein